MSTHDDEQRDPDIQAWFAQTEQTLADEDFSRQVMARVAVAQRPLSQRLRGAALPWVGFLLIIGAAYLGLAPIMDVPLTTSGPVTEMPWTASLNNLGNLFALIVVAMWLLLRRIWR